MKYDKSEFPYMVSYWVKAPEGELGIGHRPKIKTEPAISLEVATILVEQFKKAGFGAIAKKR